MNDTFVDMVATIQREIARPLAMPARLCDGEYSPEFAARVVELGPAIDLFERVQRQLLESSYIY